jgi:hypothetical protein
LTAALLYFWVEIWVETARRSESMNIGAIPSCPVQPNAGHPPLVMPGALPALSGVAQSAWRHEEQVPTGQLCRRFACWTPARASRLALPVGPSAQAGLRLGNPLYGLAQPFFGSAGGSALAAGGALRVKRWFGRVRPGVISILNL